MNENDTYVNWRAFNRALGLAAVLLIFWTSACDTSPTVYLDDESPQRFGYRGRGYLEFFVVREIAPENQHVADVEQDTDKNMVLWWIIPKDASTG